MKNKVDMEEFKKDINTIKNSKGAKALKENNSEFKKFIAKGNVMDMAVGVIVGAAFGKIVTSLVDDILMPIVGSLTGGINVSGMSIKIGEATIRYGSFVQAAIDFFIIALCMFFVVKSFNKFKEKKEEVVPAKSAEVVLLEEIRDELKTAKK